MDAVKVGALVLGAPAAREAVTGVFTDSNGEIVAYCCETGCAEAESVKEFKATFLEALKDKVENEQKRIAVMSRVSFKEKPPVQCKADQFIVFKVDYPVGAINQTSETKITMSDLGANGDTDARKALQVLLGTFNEELENGAKLTIELTVCNGAESRPAASIPAGNCADPALTVASDFGDPLEENRGQSFNPLNTYGNSSSNNSTESGAGRCLTCEPSPRTVTTYEFDWSGIVD